MVTNIANINSKTLSEGGFKFGSSLDFENGKTVVDGFSIIQGDIEYLITLTVEISTTFDLNPNERESTLEEVLVEDVIMLIDDEEIELSETEQGFLERQFEQLITNILK